MVLKDPQTEISKLESYAQQETVKQRPWILASITDCLDRVGELMDDNIEDFSDEQMHVWAHMDTLVNTLDFTSDIENKTVNGNPLRYLQKLAILWFQNWLFEKLESPKIWHIVKPMWQWKTNTAILLSGLVSKKMIYLSTDNTQIEQTIGSFNSHFDATHSSKIDRKDAHANNSHALVWMYEWFKKALENESLSLDDIWIIIVDEADINWLSRERKTYLENLAKNEWIIVIWMSATEDQASWATLQSVFKDEILRMPIPESLVELYDLGLTPDIDFTDHIIDAELYTTADSIDKWIYENESDKLLWDRAWVHSIMKYHRENNDGKTFILWYRNNKFNKLNVEIAAEHWIKLVQFTGDENMEQRRDILTELENWDIDGIVWSGLVGRGLDIPNCEVIYNSTMTYSPQIFWQLLGRWFRLDPENEDKNTKVVTFLPKSISIWEDKKAMAASFPLSSSAFFKEWYFEGEWIWENSHFRLRDLSKEQILSVADLVRRSKEARSRDAYGDNIDLISAIILKHPRLSKQIIKWLWTKSLRALSRVWKKHHRQWSDQESEHSFKKRYKKGMKKRIQRVSLGRMSSIKERELLEDFYENDSQQSLQILIDYHMPVFTAIAQSCHWDSGYIDVDDLIQSWIEVFISKIIEKNTIWEQWRIISYLLEPIYTEVERQSCQSTWEFSLWKYDEENGETSFEQNIKIKRDVLSIWEYIEEHYLYSELGKDINTLNKSDIEAISKAMKIWTKRIEVAIDILKAEYFPNKKWLEITSSDSILDETKSDDVYSSFLRDAMTDALLRLSSREQRVLQLMFWEKWTLEQVAQEFWVTRERIRQIQNKWIRLMRHPSRSKKLKSFLD